MAGDRELRRVDDGVAVGSVGENRRAVGVEIAVLVHPDDEAAIGGVADAAGAQVGFAAVGLALRHHVTNTWRFTASARAASSPVMNSFAAALIAPLRWNSMKFGTPRLE